MPQIVICNFIPYKSYNFLILFCLISYYQYYGTLTACNVCAFKSLLLFCYKCQRLSIDPIWFIGFKIWKNIIFQNIKKTAIKATQWQADWQTDLYILPYCQIINRHRQTHLHKQHVITFRKWKSKYLTFITDTCFHIIVNHNQNV